MNPMMRRVFVIAMLLVTIFAGWRIVGMMLTAGGLALCTFTLALGHWS